jgi:hypothetical protein
LPTPANALFFCLISNLNGALLFSWF